MSTDVIYEIQDALRRLHFTDNRLPPVFPSGMYDPQTKRAVEIFQQLRDLPPTGAVDTVTFERLIGESEAIRTAAVSDLPVFSHPSIRFTEGSQDESVSVVQIVLNAIALRFSNLLPVTVTGIYDRQTTDAVRVLQRIHHLEDNGELNAETWNILVNLFATRDRFGSDNT